MPGGESSVKEVAMPTYEYKCVKCGQVFDRHETVAEHGKTPPLCPKCQSQEVEPVFSAFFAKTSRKT